MFSPPLPAAAAAGAASWLCRRWCCAAAADTPSLLTAPVVMNHGKGAVTSIIVAA
jgi:hypothetical protein